jgi:IclR family transcriptional regulator, acetate operon repressor
MGSEPPVVQSLDRALSILDVLRLSDGGLALGDVASRSGLPKSTTHRLLSTLERRGLVARDPDSGTYRLATKSFEPVGAGPGVRKVLEDLAARSGETANLGALIGSDVLYVDRANSPHALRWQLGVGSRVPAYCSAMGKAILASMPPGEASRRMPRRLNAFTRHTITERRALLEELALVRHRGFALDDEEFMEGVRCVAVPIGDGAAGVARAVSLAGPAFRWTRERAEAMVDVMQEAAARMHSMLEIEQVRPSSGA